MRVNQHTLVYDYKNNIPDISIQYIEAFRRLEAFEVDPSSLAYSVILSKSYVTIESYTPQHKISKSLKKGVGDIIRCYEFGQARASLKEIILQTIRI